ncbi:NAD(P)H-hydrate dehydratase [Limisphaera ngatamarikiensis]|uniref:Bifunctional NAD(P)H-hydrate repair enzyme n=1 Tax=Limisphaera ngatamarikiensis TaxID=1324935 RepID=A0A6M1RSS6_9BACT|nr:NAD(P)H-hydrate dehydratase [Limisphaera ngatamarikiensis]NGO39685.1 NAD(P)H-hydrate dehydratase [Limisphaera ngatamarikiensis]
MPVPVVSVAQMRQWEQASWSAGRTEAAVIARVGACLAAWLRRHVPHNDRILILAGKGHNGDDARAALPHLQGRAVDLVEVRDPETALPDLERALARGPDWILDGLFGIGLNRPLAEPWCRLIERINQARSRIVSVDVPSGLDADTGRPWGATLRATCTLTLAAPKQGLLHPAAHTFTGRLEVIPDIGLVPCPIQSELCWTLPEDFLDWPPPRPVAAHKGTFGHLAIVAGSTGYHGAAVLAARAAQRARPGLITLITPASVYAVVASQLQAVMVHPWSAAHPLPGRYTALLFGPGLAAADLPAEIPATLARLWQEANVPIVVDASALDHVPRGPIPRDALRVLTPHPGEAARLLGTTTNEVQSNRVAAVRALSGQFGGAWIVLKGYQTLIGRQHGPIFVNPSGNPDLAQGGSGDVLAGYLAGLCAQPPLQGDPERLIRYAVWQHGAAADALSRRHPAWVVEDLVRTLGRVAPHRVASTARPATPTTPP